MTVAFSGYARCGKDTAAAHLVRRHGYTQLRTSAPVKRAVYVLNPIVCGTSGRRIQDVIADPFDDSYKDGPYSDEIRDLFQRQGTDVIDEAFSDPAVYARIAAATARRMSGIGQRAVLSDARRLTDFAELIAIGATICRITRPGCRPANAHVNEVEGDGWPYAFRLINDGTIDQFTDAIDLMMTADLPPADCCTVLWAAAGRSEQIAIEDGRDLEQDLVVC